MVDNPQSPDFGAGLTLDELVGMTAGEIFSVLLPHGDVFVPVGQAAMLMYQRGLGAYMLVEIWADGHTVWHGGRMDDPVIVTPAGGLIKGRG